MRGCETSRLLYAWRVRRDSTVVDVRKSVKAGMNKMMGNRCRFCRKKRKMCTVHIAGVRKSDHAMTNGKKKIMHEEVLKCDRHPEDYC